MLDVDQYLSELIRHLVALAATRGSGTSTDCVREQVEAAAAALSAAGLDPSHGVAAWGDAADEALEGAGLIRRISVERSALETVTASRGDGTLTAPPEEPGPQFVRLVAIGREFELPAGERLVLLSLTLWDRLFELNYALLDGGDARSNRVFGRHAERQWEISDDRGLRYRVGGGGGGGSGRMRHATMRVYPALPAEVSSIKLTLLAGDRSLAATEVTL